MPGNEEALRFPVVMMMVNSSRNGWPVEENDLLR